MTENWLPILGYEGHYEVSDQGRVKSLERRVKHGKSTRQVNERVLSPIKDRDGYLLVNLSVEGKMRTEKVHRLVATAFLGSNHDRSVNHINMVKTDNRVSNLEWVSHPQNLEHARVNGVFDPLKNPNIRRKLDPASVDAIRNARASGETCKNLAARFGVSNNYIYAVCSGRTWQT